MKFTVYYKLFGGPDAVIHYGSLAAMQRDVGSIRESEVFYMNACCKDDSGEDEIVFSSYKEIMSAK